MSTKLISVAAAAAVLGCASASAEPFQGAYIGLEAAYDSYSDGPDGAALAAIVGYDVKFADVWVAGGEVRSSSPDVGSSSTRTTGGFETIATVDIEDQLGASVRFGRLMTPTLLLFGQIGYERFDVNSKVTRRQLPPCTACDPTLLDFSFEENQWSFGVGAEWAASERTRVRARYVRGDSDAFENDRGSLALLVQF